MEDAGGGDHGHGPVSLDDLIALNDELVAMTRSGMPLEQGLLHLSGDLPGRLREVTAALGARMARGESLSEALAGSGDRVPRVYRAVVEAGLRSGRLPVALEGLGTYARAYAEARRSVGLALGYPLLVLAVAYGLFVFIATTVIPRFLAAFASLGVPTHAALRGLGVVGRYAWYWGPVFPAFLLVFLVAWAGAGRASALTGRGSGGLLRRFPWVGAMMREYEAAGFADLLALLVEHRVPYPEALTLAGEASGDPGLARSGRDLADAVRRGLAPAEALRGRSGLPPLLRWLIATDARRGDLAGALRQMAGRYRGNARFHADNLRVLLPTVLLFGIGATATLLYALALFVPLTSLWSGLSDPAL